jgi:hypothetical protein
MKPILLLATAAVAVSARGSISRTDRRAWNLPPPTTSQESVAAFVQRVLPRGGDQAGDNDDYDDRGYLNNNNDDPYKHDDSYNQQYGNNDNYWDQPQADDYQDDRYEDRGRGDVAVRDIWNMVHCQMLFPFWSVSCISCLFVYFCHCRNLVFKYPILSNRATDELV